MTVTNDSTRAESAVKPPIVPTRPPKFAIGAEVVLKGYEDGWRWVVMDAEVLRRKDPFWSYAVMTFRPYDGKLVKCNWPEWKLRPVPEEIV